MLMQDKYHLYFLFDLMAGGDLMDVLVAEAKVIKRRIPQGAWRRACFAPKVCLSMPVRKLARAESDSARPASDTAAHFQLVECTWSPSDKSEVSQKAGPCLDRLDDVTAALLGHRWQLFRHLKPHNSRLDARSLSAADAATPFRIKRCHTVAAAVVTSLTCEVDWRPDRLRPAGTGATCKACRSTRSLLSLRAVFANIRDTHPGDSVC